MDGFISIEIEGLAEALANFNRLERKLQRSVLRKAGRRAAKPVIAAARQNAPRRRGRLQKGIRASVKGDNATVEVKVGVAPKAFYGRFHETGTSKLPARPFLRPALEGAAAEVVSIFGDVLRDEIVTRLAEAEAAGGEGDEVVEG